MDNFLISIIIILIIICSINNNCQSFKTSQTKTKCLNPPTTAKKVEINIKECQDEVKNKIVKEAFELIHEQLEHEHEFPNHEESYQTNEHESYRRSSSYHPTLVPHEEKRIAGCLLHCVYAKNNAIDNLGWPTLDGLVEFYSDGVNEYGFFMATLRGADRCLKAASSKYHVNRLQPPKNGESCDLAFDVFDCISDQITEYCHDQYN